MITIKRSDIVDILDMVNIPEDAIREAYSGRGMYGKTCFGLDVDNHQAAYRFFAAAGQMLDEDVAVDLAESANWDSMGLGIIVYFPRITLKN